jgi:peptide-methionine (S)-S-oxide reductase
MFAIAAAIGCSVAGGSSKASEMVETPAAAGPAAEAEPAANLQTAVFAGGCFWGVEAVFESLKGVKEARSGYAGGDAKTANYDAVSEGDTKHAESVIVYYDPAKISYQQLLDVFFKVAHDPTQLNRQGPDVGPQYRSAIFYSGDEQKRLAEEYVANLDKSGGLGKPVVTQIVPLEKFYEAEKYHQNYLVRNPTQPYIVQHDLPKLADLEKKFPDIYVKLQRAK